jgi:glutamate dehydrogenase
MFHRNFLTDPANRAYIEQANIRAFIPCGGFKDTINHGNVKAFTSLFKELLFIVEGANVFFDDAARRYIATSTGILQIKDSSANKGGVYSSAVAEVLTAFLLGDEYESLLLDDVTTRWDLIRDIMDQVSAWADAETGILVRIHDRTPDVPLFVLSEKSSEQIFDFQNQVAARLAVLAADEALIWQILKAYIPPVLVRTLGQEKILQVMNAPRLLAYRNAIVTKRVAALAFYRHGLDWDAYLSGVKSDFIGSVRQLFEGEN